MHFVECQIKTFLEKTQINKFNIIYRESIGFLKSKKGKEERQKKRKKEGREEERKGGISMLF